MSDSSSSGRGADDEWVTDPIAVSLRASIDDGKTAYRDPAKADPRSLFTARTLDIWTSRKGARRLERMYAAARRPPPEAFEPGHPGAERDEKLLVRLLVTRPVMSGDYIAWHDDLNLPGQRQINHLPFVPEAVADLWHQWGLPREWPWLRLNAREVGNFQRKTDWDFGSRPPRARRIAFAINFPFVLRPAEREDFLADRKGGKGAGRRTARSDFNPWRDDPFIWSFAMSHSLVDGQTRGLLDGLTDYAYGDVARRVLRQGSHWYSHPLHMPVILLDVYFFHAAWEVNRLCVDVARFEDLSRDARVSSLERYDAITSELRYVRRALSFQQGLIKFLLDTLEFLDTKVFTTERPQDMTKYEDYVFESNPHMEEKLKNTQGLVENNIQTCDYLQSRSKDALDFINGTISLRDQASSKDDADSNKVMSLLQMSFLPATFVAAIMSINVFDFSQNPPAVDASFWVFWVVSAILTTTVLSLYFGLQFFKKQQEQRTEAKARKEEEQDRLDMVRPPSGSAGYGSDRDEKGARRRRKRSTSKPKPEAAPV